MAPASPAVRRLALAHFGLECQFWFPVWMLFLAHRGFDLTTMVLADGAFRLVVVALEFPLGVLSDRIGRKRSYALLAALSAATYGGIVGIDGTALLFGVWVLWGVAWALASGLTSAYTYELAVAEGEDAVSALGFMRAVSSAAALLSHLAAGFLFAAAPALPFVANGVLALGALALALTLPDPPPSPAGATLPPLGSFTALGRQRAPLVAGVALLALALVYFWSPRILMQPLFLELDLAPGAVSVVYFAYSLAGVAAGLAVRAAQDRLGTRAAVLAGLGLLWAGVVLVALVPGRGALFFFPLFSFGYYLAHTLLEVRLHGEIGNRHRAAVLSAASFVGGAFIIVTRPGLGILADGQGTPFAFQVWAGVGVGVLVLSGFLIRRLPRRHPERGRARHGIGRPGS